MIGLSIDTIHVGDHAEITRRASDGDIAGFVDAVRRYMKSPPLMESSAPVM